MTETEKINEELRNYKLFKIQRINTREQEFSEFRKDLLAIRKNEVLNYIIASINVLSILFLIYNAVRSYLSSYFYEINWEIIVSNFILTLCLSAYLTYKFIIYNVMLKKHIRITENAVKYFAGESENLKSIYENYVENYLESQKRKAR
ncbi:MAG: hypothetical protein J0I88_00405 [Chryseobacterium sp.]|nr:hypothetical protein [Chryseobacterium sp.]